VGEASSSFSKKRTKKLLLLKVHDMPGAGRGRVSCFFFLKKNRFLPGFHHRYQPAEHVRLSMKVRP
jgi:hypothetical protein